MLELKASKAAGVEYEQDLVRWYETQMALLRDRRFDELDVENLIEELRTAMMKERRELSSRVRVLLMHLLKCEFQHHRISGSWRGTLTEQRAEIGSLLEDSPSLRTTLGQVAEKVYPVAARLAADETGLPITAFPSSNPYSQQQLLDRDYIP